MNLIQNIAVVGAQRVSAVEGFSTFLVGMLVVFSALILLIIILELSGKFFESLDKKSTTNQTNASAEVEVVEPIIVEEAEMDEMDDLELIAVITASIAATMGTSPEGLQVRSLRKTNNAWGMSGRSEQLYNN